MVAAHPLPPTTRALVMKQIARGEVTLADALARGLLGISREDWECSTPTERMNALGIGEEVVFSGTADEAIAWIEADDACASST